MFWDGRHPQYVDLYISLGNRVVTRSQPFAVADRSCGIFQIETESNKAMGNITDMHDLERFMRSAEGKAHLEGIRSKLKNRIIVNVDFINEVHFIATALQLDSGETFTVTQPSLEVEALRNTFEEAIEREYYLDFPECKPSE